MPTPDGGVGGSKDKKPAAVWSRDALVPVAMFVRRAFAESRVRRSFT